MCSDLPHEGHLGFLGPTTGKTRTRCDSSSPCLGMAHFPALSLDFVGRPPTSRTHFAQAFFDLRRGAPYQIFRCSYATGCEPRCRIIHALLIRYFF